LDEEEEDGFEKKDEEEEEVPRPFVRTDLASIDGIDPSTIAFLAAIACSM